MGVLEGVRQCYGPTHADVPKCQQAANDESDESPDIRFHNRHYNSHIYTWYSSNSVLFIHCTNDRSISAAAGALDMITVKQGRRCCCLSNSVVFIRCTNDQSISAAAGALDMITVKRGRRCCC
eukprot:scaffold190908_cov67-Attheya_sp.AAC.2